MKAYDCVFDTSRFRDTGARALADAKYQSSQYESGYRIFVEITKFLAANGVDPVIDECKEAPRYLGDIVKQYNAEGLVHAKTR